MGYYTLGMAQELSVIVSDEDRVRLEAIVGERNRLLRHTQRARIVLLSAGASRPLPCVPVKVVSRSSGVCDWWRTEMITVYGAPPTRALRVVWMLEEMGLEYEIRQVDFAKRFEDTEFLAASPAGSIPGERTASERNERTASERN
jgi:hypothetical protein